MKNELTPKQERFALNLYKGMSQRVAYKKAGYSAKSSPTTQDRHACELAKTDKIVARVAELLGKDAAAAVMTRQERLERLSEIGRARITDFVTCKDGHANINIDLESANSAAIQEITTEIRWDGKGEDAEPVTVTKLKIRDPIASIHELNDMDGNRAPEKHEFTGKDGKPIDVNFVENAKDKLLSKLNSIAARAGEKAADPKPDGGGS